MNLADAAQKIGVLADKAAESQPDADSVVLRVVEAAEAMLEDDVAANKVKSCTHTLIPPPPLPHP